MTEQQNAVLEFLKGKIEYSFQFVPFSKSRNFQPVCQNANDFSLNWKVFIGKSESDFRECFDYSEGIAHIEGYNGREVNTVSGREALKRSCEFNAPFYTWQAAPQRSTRLPSIVDVLYCFVSEYSVLDETFENWAADCGYDTDSRKAEKLYNECRENALKLRRIFGEKNIITLQQMLENY